ncbi:MAG TPA: AMP-binding protein [Caulobacteraceae bacterium]|nr:AMP-binding protein [Caulobacteraceae bacterium]
MGAGESAAPSGLQAADLVFHWARRVPDKAAIVSDGRVFSYRGLAHRIAQARAHFSRQGLGGPGTAVVAVADLASFWILSLALRSLGLTTIQPRPGEPFDALDLPDARCVVGSNAEQWPDLERMNATAGLPVLVAAVDDEAPLWPFAAGPAPAGGHILQTSGTTGLQKKVLMAPSFEPAYIRYRRAVMDIPHESVGALFDFAAWTGAGYKGVVSSLTAGATVVIDQRPDRHAALLRYPGVTYAVIVPTMARAILNAPLEVLPFNPGLQIQIAGGALSLREIEALKARVTPHLFNSFGSTEARPTAFTPMLTAEDYRWHRLVPGRGVEVVDDQDRPLPAGQIGRLRVTTTDGPTGYLNDEAATHAFFRDGYFYPGDLAVIREDGRMALHGRVTDVINQKGQKILPAPIEDRLRDIFEVSGVCLFSMQNAAGEEEIHVIIETARAIAPDRLAEALNRELPGFPGAHVHFAPALPRNPMGKVLRLAAREQALAAARARA